MGHLLRTDVSYAYAYLNYYALIKINYTHLARSYGVAWGGKCHPWATGCQLFAAPGNFFAIFYCCFIFVAKERSDVLIELNLGLFEILETSSFSCTHIIHLIVLT